MLRFLILFLAVAISYLLDIDTGAPVWAAVLIGANVIATPSLIAKEAAFQIHNQLGLASRVHTDFDKDFTGGQGDTVDYRLPSRYLVNDGMDITSVVQDLNEPTGQIVVDQWKNVAFAYTAKERALDITEFSRRHIAPGIEAIVNAIDVGLTGLYEDVYQASGSAGSAPDGYDDMADLEGAMTDALIPRRGRNLIVDSFGGAGLRKGLASLFEPTMVKGILKESSLGRLSGMELFTSQNVRKHTAGDFAAALVAGVPSEGATTIDMDTFTNSGAAQLKKGDIFTLPGVNAVNPITKEDTGRLQQFTLTADTTVTTNAATVPVSPALIASATDPHRNITALPADNVAVTALADHTANLAFHKNAFSLVSVPIPALTGGIESHTESYEQFAVTVTMFADGMTMKQYVRLDVLFGLKASNPNLAYRLLG